MNKNKQKWISDKISKLVKEGKSREQAIAQSYSMYNQMLKGGTYSDKLPKYQVGTDETQGEVEYPGWAIPGSYNPYRQQTIIAQNNSVPQAMGWGDPLGHLNIETVQATPEQLKPVTTAAPTSQVNVSAPTNYTPPTDEEIEMYELQQKTQEVQDFAKTLPVGLTQDEQEANMMKELIAQNTPVQGQLNEEEKKKPQMFNPFGSIGLEQSLAYAGQGFGEKDPSKAAIGTGLSLLKGTRTFMSGMGIGREEKRIDSEYAQNMQEEERYLMGKKGGYTSYRQGGDITNGEQMTGEFLTENLPEANVELEDGEYTENSQTGEIQETVGEKHDNGGVKTNLPDKSKVISDYTKIGSKNSKMFKEDFDIKVRATDTFATVLDKYNKKIGLDTLIKEEEEIFKKIEKQESSSDIKENVKALNMTALQKRLEDIAEEKSEIKVQQKEAFDKIFEAQEKIPKKKGKDEMKEGGVYNDIDFLSKKYKIDKDRLTTLMQEGGVKIGPKKVTKKEADEMVKKGIWEDLGNGKYIKKGVEGFEGITYELTEKDIISLKEVPNAISGGNPTKAWDQKMTDLLNSGVSYEELAKKGHGTLEGLKKRFPNQYKPQTTQEEILVPEPWEVEGTPDQYFYVEENGETTSKDSEGNIVEKDTTTKDGSNTKGNISTRKNSSGIPMIPQDFILPPDARREVYKQQVELGRIDPIKTSAEPALVEIERQRQAMEQALQFLPPAQRAAAMANALGQTQEASNKAIGQTELTNAQGQYQADQFNLQAQAKQDLLNTRFNQDYENKTMSAITNQQRDVRQYFNDLNDAQRFNFEYVDRRNLLNQATPNYNVSGASNVEFAGGAAFNNITPDYSLQAFFNDPNVSPEEKMKRMKELTQINNNSKR